MFQYSQGCESNPDACNESELKYLLPESNKNGIAFYDNFKEGSKTDLGCNQFESQYSFDLVIWVHKRVNFTNDEFCDSAELTGW